MNILKLASAIVTITLLSACQTTVQTANTTTPVTTEPNIAKSTTITNTTPLVLSSFKSRTEKRSLTTDGQLAFSLANRAVPQDQLMMLAFEQTRKQHYSIQTGYFVDIRGSRSQDPGANRTQMAWQEFDANAKTISGPK